MWVREFLGLPDAQVHTCLSSEKKNYCQSPNQILIDDRVDMCKAWEKAGGISVHHQPHNALRSKFLLQSILFPTSYNEEVLASTRALLGMAPLSFIEEESRNTKRENDAVGLEPITLPPNSFMMISCHSSLADLDYFLSLLSFDEDIAPGEDVIEKRKRAGEDGKVVAFDVEWRPDELVQRRFPRSKSKAAILQLTVLKKEYRNQRVSLNHVRENATMTFLVDMCHPNSKIESAVLRMCTRSDVLKVGYGVEEDCARLLSCFSHSPPSSGVGGANSSLRFYPVLDLQSAVTVILPIRELVKDMSFPSSISHNQKIRLPLSRSCEIILKQSMGLKSKMMQAGDWETRPLTEGQLQYAAQDAFCLMLLFCTLTDLHSSWGEVVSETLAHLIGDTGSFSSRVLSRYIHSSRCHSNDSGKVGDVANGASHFIGDAEGNIDKITYTAILLSREERKKLLAICPPVHSQYVSGDHITLAFKPSVDHLCNVPLGLNCEVIVHLDQLQADSCVQAVPVSIGDESVLFYCENDIPHITISCSSPGFASSANNLLSQSSNSHTFRPTPTSLTLTSASSPSSPSSLTTELQSKGKGSASLPTTIRLKGKVVAVVGATYGARALEGDDEAEILGSLPISIRKKLDAFIANSSPGERLKLPVELSASERYAVHVYAEMHGHTSFSEGSKKAGNRRIIVTAPKERKKAMEWNLIHSGSGNSNRSELRIITHANELDEEEKKEVRRGKMNRVRGRDGDSGESSSQNVIYDIETLSSFISLPNQNPEDNESTERSKGSALPMATGCIEERGHIHWYPFSLWNREAEDFRESLNYLPPRASDSTAAPLNNQLRKVMFIMRGVPGCGKSSLVQQYVDRYAATVCSADGYFEAGAGKRKKLFKGKTVQEIYNMTFDVNELPAAHEYCRAEARSACERGDLCIIIDNTNIEKKDYAYYSQCGRGHGYLIYFVSITCRGHDAFEICYKRNQHSLPRSALRKMMSRWSEIPYTLAEDDEGRKNEKSVVLDMYIPSTTESSMMYTTLEPPSASSRSAAKSNHSNGQEDHPAAPVEKQQVSGVDSVAAIGYVSSLSSSASSLPSHTPSSTTPDPAGVMTPLFLSDFAKGSSACLSDTTSLQQFLTTHHCVFRDKSRQRTHIIFAIGKAKTVLIDIRKDLFQAFLTCYSANAEENKFFAECLDVDTTCRPYFDINFSLSDIAPHVKLEELRCILAHEVLRLIVSHDGVVISNSPSTMRSFLLNTNEQEYGTDLDFCPVYFTGIPDLEAVGHGRVGWHIKVPDVLVSMDTLYRLRTALVRRLQNLFPALPFALWSNAIDETVYDHASLRMFGSRKVTKKSDVGREYALLGVYIPSLSSTRGDENDEVCPPQVERVPESTITVLYNKNPELLLMDLSIVGK